MRPYTGAPKTRRVLDPNLRRGLFRGVCNTPLHVYVQNPPGFIFPHTDTQKTHPILGANPCRRIFRGVCNTPLHGYTQKIVWFHIPPPGYVKNAPDFTLPNKDTPKTCPVLHPNRRRRIISGRMLLRPTRVRAKPVRFHISAHVPAKNAPDFILSNKDTPKTRPVLHPNLRRGYLSGVCNTPLHGYVQNSTGFRRKSLSQDISGRMQYAPTRIHEKSARFHISAHGYVKNAPDFILPNRDTPKTRPVSHFRTRTRRKRTRFHYPQ